MKNNSIKFHCTKDQLDSFPHPRRSGKMAPQYYKKLNSYMNSHPKSSTAKKCVPFLQAISSGYIIPLWADMYVTVGDNDIDIEFPEHAPIEETIEYHEYSQLKDYPLSREKHGTKLMKFINPWIIETPPGVSCLFTSPLNHFETRFKLADGIVDTDSYYNNINFPFTWTGGTGEFYIERGTPLVQVMPFVRYDFDSEIGIINNEKNKKIINIFNTVMTNGYKKFFWHKRQK